MKPIAALLASLAVVATSYAQNTYPWPASGSVGIGTTSPSTALEVNGSVTATGLYSFIAKAPDGYWGFNHRNYYAGQGGNVYNVGFSSGAIGVFNGSTTAEDVYLFNRNNPAGGYLVLKANNNVGIGTANPSAKLHILSSPDSSRIVWDEIINNPANAGTTGYGTGLKLQNSILTGGNELYKWVGIAAVAGSSWSNETDFVVYTNNFDPSANLTSESTERLRVQGMTGNVGIGTTTPGSLLEMKGVAPILTLNGTDNTQFKGINFATNGSVQANLLANIQSGELKLQSGTPGFGGFITFNLDGGEKIRIQANTGNVGIGTTNPTQKLSVNGTVRAKEVIVDTSWSDYVFADDYKLQSLTDVEAAIKTNKHLPGVPSAQEVAEKGVSVGDMQAVLLAKIEELTLHQIEQQRQLNVQRAEIATLKAENARLK